MKTRALAAILSVGVLVVGIAHAGKEDVRKDKEATTAKAEKAERKAGAKEKRAEAAPAATKADKKKAPSGGSVTAKKEGARKVTALMGDTKSTKASESGAEEGVLVSRAAICTDIENREPQGDATNFSADVGKLYCFTHIKGVQDTLLINHQWYRNDEAYGGPTTLPVRSASWRTYSSRQIGEGSEGNWKVEVVNTETDDVIETVNFAIE
ncbi:MAG: DUF2914 domain-containing protein [Chitinivibrionales bacterium]|nr:DUF2914 domain-containing protein [Chitinivibrionales bacterium]MBD3356501.1 DUF2914 domain-containing protein [Chitinivibrionales bacterium]